MSLTSPDMSPNNASPAPDAEEYLNPAIYVLGGQTIHSKLDPATPLYSMDRGVASLTGSSAKVTFERVTHKVNASKTTPTGEPTLSSRNRHIFDLKRIDKEEGGAVQPKSSSLPDYYIESTSRTTLGSFGVRKHRGRSKWTVAEIDTKTARKSYGLPEFVQDGSLLASVVVQGGITRWVDGQGDTMATEDHKDGRHTINVTKELSQNTIDAMVALWCCRMWQYSATHTPELYSGLDRFKKKFRHISTMSVLFHAINPK